MYICILLLPCLGFVLAGLFGRYLGRLGSAYCGTICMVLTWLISLIIFYEVCLCRSTVIVDLYNWILIDIYDVSFGLLFDPLSSIMVVVVVTISSLVHIYSIGYMSHDPLISRFMSYLSMFTFFMLVLVTSSNMVQMFIGWEGVGVCSYLLINFWFTRVAANKSALKAMIMNRIADVFFVVAIIYVLLVFKTTDYIILNTLLPLLVDKSIVFLNIEFKLITIMAFFLFVGAIGKSAQLGLHTWLPDAMEGPTPVSSLLHAATMVTAGVFLVIRCSIFMEHCPGVLFLLIIFGGLTALFGGFVAIFQYDIKKIIAYSTCSQLGYMFFSCGISNYHIAFFHLFNHAFFKCLLFLSAGSIIHRLFDEQDMRRMGGLNIILPFTYACILIGSLAITGFPFLTGFYSKDLILEFAYSRFIIDALFIYSVALISAIFTAIYSFRLILFVFSNATGNRIYRTFFEKYEYDDMECPPQMYFSMLVLAIASIFIGYFFNDLLFGFGVSIWNASIYVSPENYAYMDQEFIINPYIKNMPVICSGIAAGLTLHTLRFLNANLLRILKEDKFEIYPFFIYIPLPVEWHKPLYNIWYYVAGFGYHAGYFNNIYNVIYIYIFKYSYSIFNKYLDKGLFEYCGPYGMYKLFLLANQSVKYLFPGLTSSIFYMFLSVNVFIYTFLLVDVYLHLIIASNLPLQVVFIEHLGVIIMFIFALHIYLKYINNNRYDVTSK